MKPRPFHRAPTHANHHMGVHSKRDPLGDYRRHQSMRNVYLSHGQADVVVSVTKDLQAEGYLLSVRLRLQRTALAAWTKPNGYVDQPFPTEAAALAAQRNMVAYWRESGWKPVRAQPQPAARPPTPSAKKAAWEAAAKPARKAARKPARKATAKAKPARKVARKAAAKPARKVARKSARKR